jgi:hypothetical protein
MMDEAEEDKEEGLELETVVEAIELEDDGVGVGETALSSSVEEMDVRVELEIMVDCADGVAT